MHCIAYFRLDRFYVDALAASGASCDLRAVAVHHEKRVIDLNQHAEALGLKQGMALAEAKTLLKDAGSLFAYEPETYRAPQKRFLDRLAQFGDRIEPGMPHEAWIDLSKHPRAESVAWEIQSELKQAGYVSVRMGFASSKWLAQLCSCEPLPEQRIDWELTACEWLSRPDEVLKDRPLQALTCLPYEVIARLKFLGYRRIGEVAALPLKVLKQQFGDSAWKIRDAAQGLLSDPVLGVYPEQRAIARLEISEGVIDQEGINAVLRKLAERLGDRLQDQDEYASDVRMWMRFESGAERKLSRTFSKPMSTASQVMTGLKLMLPVMLEPVVEVRVELPGLKKNVRKQRQLDAGHDPRERKLSAEVAFTAIRKVYGDHAVQVAVDLPQPRRVKVLRAWSDATGWR
jgi:nucleotidyltransferase/DNA polymerase involved in DNA repair